MTDRRATAHQAVLLAGAVIILGFAIANLPDGTLLRAPATPIDHSATAQDVSDYLLLTSAATVIPPEASVAALSQPPDPVHDTSLHRTAVALLPGRRIFAAALWYSPRPIPPQTEFLVVAGQTPLPPLGRLLLQTPWGSVWKRQRS